MKGMVVYTVGFNNISASSPEKCANVRRAAADSKLIVLCNYKSTRLYHYHESELKRMIVTEPLQPPITTVFA